MKKSKISYFLLSFIFFTGNSFSQNDQINDAIHNLIEYGAQHNGVAVDGTTLANQTTLPLFYTNHNYEPVWTSNTNVNDILKILKSSYEEGLNPEDYHISQIEKYLNTLNNDRDNPQIQILAKLDLLLTDATSIYSNHLLHGKVQQSNIRSLWNVPKNPPLGDPDSLFTKGLKEHRLLELFNTLKPTNFMYYGLKEGLRRYREIAANGGWEAIPAGETLKIGITDERVGLIRKRLAITGDYVPDNNLVNENYFDDNLEEAVKQFQFRHNLIQDGAIGKNTIAMMNVPVKDRINTIRINMERARWIMHNLYPDFLIVNIAGFNLRRVTDGNIVFCSPVIVGKQFHETPIFKAKLLYFEINPTWTVPYSIATKEMLLRLKRNPNYINEKNMVIMDRNGKILDPLKIDFSKYSANNFPFIIRQEPGPRNALGQVKFIFPNPYSVYVHDTPSKSLFSREKRDFSHGCVRIEKRWELLMNLMDEPDVWNMGKINEILKTKKTTRVNLKKPMDIYILYWTAGADKKYRIFFDKDVYNRDNAVLKALDAPVSYLKIQANR